MNPVKVFGWLAGLAGAGLVGFGALLMLNQAVYSMALTFAILGTFIIIAGMAAVSIPSTHKGMGVIY